MNQSIAVQSLAALAHPLRLQVFRALVAADPAGLTPGTIADALAVPGPTLSFHLKELVHAGLVTQQRASRHLIYKADHQQVRELMAYLGEHCSRAEA